MRDRKAWIVAVLALFLASSQFQAVASAALPGPILAQEDDPGWLGSFIEGVAQSLYGAIQKFWRELICRMRTGMVDAIASFWCLRSAGGTELNSNNALLLPIPDCDCSLCGTAAVDYSEYILQATEWVAGANKVFSKFVPWELWVSLYTTYILAAVGIWVARLFARLGIGFFGWMQQVF